MEDGAERHRRAATIVGAGPVGLMIALLLARQGIGSTIVERFRTRHGAPKAHALNPRSLEICKAVGLDVDRMTQSATPRQDGGWVRFMTNLAGTEIGALPYERQDDDVRELTPTPLINLAQPDFENFLLDMVVKTPLIVLKRGLEWVSCRQDAYGVISAVRDVDSGDQRELRSTYLIAADGAGSTVRRQLGIGMSGDGVAQSFITMHFGANLREIVASKPGILYWIMQPPHTGVLIAYDIDSNWCLLYPYDPEVTPRETFTPDVCREILNKVIGRDDISIEIKHILPWVMMSEVADQYRVGNVFVVGDAAHRFPPTGGLGLNTGLQDAHNLAWKIAAVEKHGASETLLDTYESERRGVAVINAGQSFKNAQRILGLQKALRTETNDDPEALLTTLADPAAQREIRSQIENQREHFDSLALQLGFTYGKAATTFGNISHFKPELEVGARFPHAWLRQNGKSISSLDLLSDTRFTLFIGENASVIKMPLDFPLTIVRPGLDFVDESGRFIALLGLTEKRAVLVRPDGHIAAILTDGQVGEVERCLAHSLHLAEKAVAE